MDLLIIQKDHDETYLLELILIYGIVKKIESD